jgi:hypothetical protein
LHRPKEMKQKMKNSSKVSVIAIQHIAGKFMQLPLSRVRSIILKDEEYSLINKQALVVITKATELFVQDLAGVCGQIAKVQKRKGL